MWRHDEVFSGEAPLVISHLRSSATTAEEALELDSLQVQLKAVAVNPTCGSSGVPSQTEIRTCVGTKRGTSKPSRGQLLAKKSIFLTDN